jgi:F-box protein 21
VRSSSLHRFDVWDALEIEQARPYLWDADTIQDSDMEPCTMTRTFWASALLGAITRHYAVQVWAKAVAAQDDAMADPEPSFEGVFLGLSSFYGVSPFAVSRRRRRRPAPC